MGNDCSTTVPGLFAAGDVATRKLVASAISGGGAQNSAWALSSGRWEAVAMTAHARWTTEAALARGARCHGAGLQLRYGRALPVGARLPAGLTTMDAIRLEYEG